MLACMSMLVEDSGPVLLGFLGQNSGKFQDTTETGGDISESGTRLANRLNLSQQLSFRRSHSALSIPRI